MSNESIKIELSKKKFGVAVKKIRESKGMTQLDLATAVNLLNSDSAIEKTTISRIENARTNVTLTTIVRLSIALEVDIKRFFDNI